MSDDYPTEQKPSKGSGIPDAGTTDGNHHVGPWSRSENRSNQINEADSFRPGDLTQRHTPKEIPVSGASRVGLFLLGIAILVTGLSLAVPSQSVWDPHLIKAILILSIFGSVAVYWSRESLKKLLKMAGLWTLIIAAISTYYLFQSDFGDRLMAALDPSTAILSEEGMIIHKAADGHFYVRTMINGETIRMMVDTGASNIVLSPADAKRVGLNPSTLAYTGRAETANGTVPLARAKVDSLRIGDALLENVSVTVNGSEMRGSLLGLSALSSFASFEFRGDKLILRP